MLTFIHTQHKLSAMSADIKRCGDCKLCIPVSFTTALEYAANATGVFGEEKGEEVLDYIQAIRNEGGGQRTCSAPPPPFVYPNHKCQVVTEFKNRETS